MRASEARVSRSVLREAGGEIPSAYSPVSAAAVAQKEWVRRLVQSGGQRQSSQIDPANRPTLDAPSTQRQDALRSGTDVQQPYPRLDQLLRSFLQVGSLSRPAPHRPYLGTMGASEVQVAETAQAKNASLASARRATSA